MPTDGNGQGSPALAAKDVEADASLTDLRPDLMFFHDAVVGRRGRGRSAKTLKLRERAKDILEEIQPATVRAVCYRLFSEGYIRSMAREEGETARISNILVEGREEGFIPWEHLVDNTRRPHVANVFSTPKVFSETVNNCYAADPWENQPVRVEVWSEKDTVSGILAPVLDEMKVTFRVNRGFASATVINDIVNESLADERPLVALYVGDYDPSGLYMSAMDLPRRIREYGGKVEVRRIALVEEDLDVLGEELAFKVESKSDDTRYTWFLKTTVGRKTLAWELDAMDPNALRARVRGAIRDYIIPEAWERVMVGERAIRQSLNVAMKGWLGAIPDQSGNTGSRR